MHKLNGFYLLAALFVFTCLASAEAFGAELEGALQYPPRSVGEDAQPPPAKMLPQPVSPWRIELGVSGSSEPPDMQRFYILSRSAGLDLAHQRRPGPVQVSGEHNNAGADCLTFSRV